MPTIPYSRAALTDDTRRKLGDSFYAEFLSLGYQVNEVQLYMQFVLACLPHEYPENTPFREKARINGNASVRLLCARLYEVSNLVGKMGSSVNWRKGFPLVAESFKKNMNDSQEGITTRRKTAEFDLVRLVRDKGFAHISPQEVHKRLNKTHANAQRFLYFSDTYANAFFPACEDLVFGNLLHDHFRGANGGNVDQDGYSKWLSWVCDFCSMVCKFFHYLCIWVWKDLQGFDLEDVELYLDENFIGDGGVM